MILASQSPRRIELMREAGYEFSVIPARVDETPLEGEDPFALVARLSAAKAHAVAESHAAPGEVVVAADTIVTLDGEALGKPADADDACRMLRELSGRTHQVATGVCLLRAAGEGAGAAGADAPWSGVPYGGNDAPVARKDGGAADREDNGRAGREGGDAAGHENGTRTAQGSGTGAAVGGVVRAAAREDAFTAVTDVEFYELTDDEIEAYVATGEPFDKAGAYGIQGEAGRMLVRGIRGDFYNVVGLPIAEVVRHLRAL